MRKWEKWDFYWFVVVYGGGDWVFIYFWKDIGEGCRDEN